MDVFDQQRALEQQSTEVDFEELPMRIGLGSFTHPGEERLRFIKQLGVDDVLLNMYQAGHRRMERKMTRNVDYEQSPLPGEAEWSYRNLVRLRNRVEDAGLRLNAIENLPYEHYDQVMLGGNRQDEQLDHVKTTIRNMGEAGIPMLGYSWMPSGVWRTSKTRRIRGGAKTAALDIGELENAPLTHGREYSGAEMWDNYERFLAEVLPVAEEAGVKLALHPNDPPIEEIGGVPQLFRDRASFERAMETVPSDNHGLEFCLGNWSAMGEDIQDAIDYFGSRDELFEVHFQTVSSSLPRLHETFVDQEGYYDPYEVLVALDDVGFSGMIIPGHVPRVEGDDDWKERGRAFTVGYLRGMLSSIRHRRA